MGKLAAAATVAAQYSLGFGDVDAMRVGRRRCNGGDGGNGQGGGDSKSDDVTEKWLCGLYLAATAMRWQQWQHVGWNGDSKTVVMVTIAAKARMVTATRQRQVIRR